MRMMLKAVVEKTRRYTALVVFAVLFLLNVSLLRVFSCPFSRRRSIRRWINQPTIEQIEKFVVLTNGTSGVYESNKEVEDDGTHSVVFKPHRETAVSTESAKKLNQIAPGREPRDAKNKRVPWCGKFEGNEQGPQVLPFSLTSVSPDWTCHYPPTSSILLFLSPCFSL